MFADLIAEHRAYLTELDSAIGDADHGINMDRGMQAVRAKLDATPLGAADELFKLVGMTLVSSIGGASGPLYGTFFLRFGTACGPSVALSADDVVKAFRAGVEGLVARGKPELGDKTMFDSLHPALEALDAASWCRDVTRRRVHHGVAGRDPRPRRHHPDGGPQGSGQLPRRAQRRPPGSRRHLLRVAVRSRRRAHSRVEVAMVGIVVVSHSRRLADAAVELALQMVRGTPPPIEVAAGLDGHVLGTDAARVKEAIDRVASPDGVLVIMDLGSAVLSAELALELRGDTGDCPIVLSDGPIVEGLVAAVALAAAGASLAEVAADAAQAGQIKTKLLGIETPGGGGPWCRSSGAAPASSSTLHNEHGLHARPAARFVETVRRFDADVTVRNLTTDGPAVSGRSVSALSTLGVPTGDQIDVSASGRQAREALAAIAALGAAELRRTGDRASARSVETKGAGPTAASPGIGIGPKTSLPDTDRRTTRHDSRHTGGGDRAAPRRRRSGPGRAQLDHEITSPAPPASTRPRSSTPTCSSSTTTSSSAPRSS